MLMDKSRSEITLVRIQRAVEDGLKAKGVSARRASIDVVGHDGLIRDIRAGIIPGTDRLDALCEYLGLELHIGPRRRVPGYDQGDRATDDGRSDAAEGGYLPVLWHPAAKMVGTAHFAIAHAWLDDVHLSPENTWAVVPGHSPAMPGLETGVAIIDSSARQAGPPRPWAVAYDSKIYVVDVQFDTRATLLLGFNNDGSARLLFDSERDMVEVLGKVVWACFRPDRRVVSLEGRRG
jgi:hypothetical protein